MKLIKRIILEVKKEKKKCKHRYKWRSTEFQHNGNMYNVGEGYHECKKCGKVKKQ